MGPQKHWLNGLEPSHSKRPAQQPPKVNFGFLVDLPLVRVKDPPSCDLDESRMPRGATQQPSWSPGAGHESQKVGRSGRRGGSSFFAAASKKCSVQGFQNWSQGAGQAADINMRRSNAPEYETATNE
jgi:hypothetical protein